MMTQLNRRALNRALLARQMLLRREQQSAANAIEHLVGLQAQNPLDPYYALAARLDAFRPAELADLLTEREVVRIAVMRATIHLVTARDCLAVSPLMQPVLAATLQSAFGRQLDGIDRDEVAATGREWLAAEPRTTRELRRLLRERWPEHDAEPLSYAVRYLLPLVQVPPRGVWGLDRQPMPVVTPADTWLGVPFDAAPSPDEVVLRYLAAFGPASNADIRTWSRLTGVSEITERLRPRLRTFQVEDGRELFDVADGLLPDPDTPAPPRFLPEFDNVFLSHEDRARIIDPAVHVAGITVERTVRKLLIDGFVRAEWTLTQADGDATLKIESHGPLSSTEQAAVEAEAAGLVELVAPGCTQDVEFAIRG